MSRWQEAPTAIPVPNRAGAERSPAGAEPVLGPSGAMESNCNSSSGCRASVVCQAKDIILLLSLFPLHK